ncbi:hypothetical protein BBW65_00330 [Helicobacter enhydrae]|uniref:Uncharacterized protein n=1 Tax=Helicobacter enhydrae TaxID=222136 RepID=A0A1B1U3N4_9HELI|nr:hypothetical protein BBW65_00330 [Helicobacter enhydrae]
MIRVFCGDPKESKSNTRIQESKNNKQESSSNIALYRWIVTQKAGRGLGDFKGDKGGASQ